MIRIRRVWPILLCGALGFSAMAAAGRKPANTRAPATKPLTVSIDVKDEDVHAILKTMQKQCGIRNLVIDPDVQGKGTFLFHAVPCSVAFTNVLRTMGLSSTVYSSEVVTVQKQ